LAYNRGIVALEIFVLIFTVAAGLVAGSYLNVLIHRLPRGQSTVLPRSRCPYCDGTVRAVDNIPLLSFLLLGGRCRHCRAPISWRYPFIEALTALLFVLCLFSFGLTGRAAASALFCCLMLALALIDLEHYLLPDKLTLPGIVAGLALQPWLPATTFLDAVVGTFVGAGIVILLMNFWYWWRGEEGMGLGDVNMMALIGAFLGWQGVLITLLLGALSGALVGIFLMLRGRLQIKSKLPFGTFLAFAAIIALFAGDRLIAYYSRLLFR
jgi:leader peptidase (prepilin peptidase)/N-methyltransferase